MGFQSQAGHVGGRTQSVKGTPVVLADLGMFFRTRSGAMGGARELLIPDPEIGGGRDVADAYLGPAAFKGSYDFYARMEMLSFLLKGALGVVDTNTGVPVATVNEHLITPTDSSLPWLTIEERIGDGYEAFRYTDAKVSSFHLEAEANGYLMGTVELIALESESIGASFTAPADRPTDNTPMVVGSNILVEFNGVQLPAKSFTFDLNNNIEDDDFRLGSLHLGDLVEKRREVTAGVTVRPEDGDLWRQATYGDPDATSIQGTTVKGDVHIICETYEKIGATDEFYTLDLAFPVGVIAPFEATPSGDDVLEHDIEVRLLRPDVLENIVNVRVLNDITAIP